jgi:amino acid transporter
LPSNDIAEVVIWPTPSTLSSLTAALMTGSLQFSRSFIGGAISTAASPLGSSFVDISCRSPVTPRRPTRHNGNGDGEPSQSNNNLYVDIDRSRNGSYRNSAFLPTPKGFPVTPAFKESRITDNGVLNSKLEDDQRSSITLVSPLLNSRSLPQTPLLLYPSANGSNTDPDDGKIGTISAINLIIGKTIGVGVYSVPSSIFVGVGSVGMSILMWVLGAVISFCGLAVYLDLGTSIPKSGGERVYLERIFRRPKMLASCMFGAYVVLLGFSTPNCIVLGEYILYAFGIDVNRWNVRSIAVGIVTLLCLVHAWYPKLGLRIINVLGISKMLILVVVILAGIASMVMHTGRPSPLASSRLDFSSAIDAGIDGDTTMPTLSTAQRNFSNIWAGSSTQPYDYATALLKVLYCFRGYSTCNQVLSSVRRPVQTLQIAAPIALGLVSAGYIIANIAYFLAVEKDDFRTSGVVVAGHFFKNVFGVTIGERILPCFVVVSAFGNVAATSFAQARVNQELGRDGLLPFAKFWEGEKGVESPARGLFLHWLISVLVIVVPPPGSIYNFLVDIGGYPVSVISVAIALGLLYLQSTTSENWTSPFRARKIYTIIFAASNAFLLIFPWIKPRSGLGDGGRFPYYAYPATALGILASGVLYWVWWAGFGNGRASRGSGGNRIRGYKSSLSYEIRRVIARGCDENASGDEHEGEGLLARTSEENKEREVDVDGMRRRAPCGCPAGRDIPDREGYRN